MSERAATATESQRLDQFVAQAFTLSRNQAIKRIRGGLVQCNGEAVRKASKKLKLGDTITLKELSHKPNLQPSTFNLQPLDILYEDDVCLVVYKPADIVVHPSGTMDQAEATVMERLMQQMNTKELFLVHRLDKGTTGCLLVAKSPGNCEKLQEQFKNRTVRKRYLAIVAGVPKEKQATIEAPLGRSLLQRTKMSLFQTSKSRHAVTTYMVLSMSPEAALLQCDPQTGRMHQIRVHLHSIGHPLLGDEKYATEESRKLSEKYGVELPCLHAYTLDFVSPATKEHVSVEAPIPEEFQKSAEKIGLTIS